MIAKYLIDTHAWLWWNLKPELLNEAEREIISDGRNQVFFSAASAWEIDIKYG